MKKKFLLIFLILSLIFKLIATSGFMLFTDLVQKDMSSISGTVSISLVDEVMDEYSHTKSFKIESNGNLPTYVRIKLIPTVEYFDDSVDDWIITDIPRSDISITVDAQDWILSDGYYYYKDILLENEKTTDVIISCGVIIPKTISYENIRVSIKTIFESCQARNELWKDEFDIDSLPEGVETIDY